MDTKSYCFEPNEVFDGRNKAYGAYWLRKIYSKRLSTALLIGGAAFTLAVASPVIMSGLAPEQETEDLSQTVVELANLEPPPLQENTPPPPPLPPPPPPPKVETVRFVPPEPAPDEEVPEEEIPPPQDELKEVQVADVTQEGDPNASLDEIIVEDVPPPVVAPPPPQEDEVFLVVEQQPQFPGGMQALAEFLQKEVRYPEIARKAGVEGKVFVQFVVGNDGEIRDVQVVRGIGGGCDEEAIRLVNAMPNWIPGKQNGRAVSVRFSMPITFKLR
jgi:periplasmic protein TonB